MNNRYLANDIPEDMDWIDYAAIHAPNPIPETYGLELAACMYDLDLPDIMPDSPGVIAGYWDQLEARARFRWAQAMADEKRRCAEIRRVAMLAEVGE